jgi:hypothetical protein
MNSSLFAARLGHEAAAVEGAKQNAGAEAPASVQDGTKSGEGEQVNSTLATPGFGGPCRFKGEPNLAPGVGANPFFHDAG